MQHIILTYTTQIPVHWMLKKNTGMCWIKRDWLEMPYVKLKMTMKVVISSMDFFQHQKLCSTIDKFGIVQKDKIFKGFNDNKGFWIVLNNLK